MTVIMLKKFLPFLPVLLLAGCDHRHVHAHDAGQQPRNANNLYPVEVAFNSGQQSLRWDSIKPYVIVNGQPLAAAPGAGRAKPLGRPRARAADRATRDLPFQV